MNDIVYEVSEDGVTGMVLYDGDPESPRNWDNIGVFVTGRNSGVPNELDGFEFSRNRERDKVKLAKEHDAAIILPVFMYSHSGSTISTTPFNCCWDSGQIGWYFASKEVIRTAYGVKKLTRKVLDRVQELLIGEIAVYDYFMQGEVYGYTIVDADGSELAACWGFYGLEDLQKELKSLTACWADRVNRMRYPLFFATGVPIPEVG